MSTADLIARLREFADKFGAFVALCDDLRIAADALERAERDARRWQRVVCSVQDHNRIDGVWVVRTDRPKTPIALPVHEAFTAAIDAELEEKRG